MNTPTAHRPNVFVIDDDELICDYLVDELTELNFNPIVFTSGDGVMEAIRSYSPVACFVDMVMKGKEGMETIIDLNKLEPKPVVIAISGHGTYLFLSTSLGANEVLSKPFAAGDVARVLKAQGLLA